MNVLSFGEVLWDVYPDRKCLGGAPLNFAAHLAKHGERAYMLSAVGDDALGAEAVAQIRRWGVRTDYIGCSAEKQTGACLVTLDENSVPSYNLLNDVAYDAIPAQNLPDDFDVLYFGTLSLRGAENFRTLRSVLQSHHFREVFVDVNIRPPFYSEESVRFALEHATILKISEEELPKLYAVLGMESDMPYDRFAEELARTNRRLTCLIVTLGAEGAFVRDCVSGETYTCGSSKVEVKSTVGAGDSFSAAFLSKYAGGAGIPAALKHAVKVAGFVVSAYDAVPCYDPRDFE